MQVNIHEAKTQLSRILEELSEGRLQEVIIAKAGKPVAKLIPYTIESDEPRKPGLLKGKISIAADFDDPDPAFEALFYEETNQ
ncbi:MAG: type II toxin-antitoxin system Phd/YefM family antitoxin [Gemmatimonadaceae bacterium]|nr:type II toxin-antitoxin system Phd/YefM family antitoxin [Gloeobacterales cyanobacterium ES-bin-141]